MQERYPFENAQEKILFQNLTQTLRCMICQNQSLAESEAPIAVILREEIYRQIKEEKSYDTIVEFMQVRYGQEIRMQPALGQHTILLWFGPLIVLALGIYFFWKYLRTAR